MTIICVDINYGVHFVVSPLVEVDPYQGTRKFALVMPCNILRIYTRGISVSINSNCNRVGTIERKREKNTKREVQLKKKIQIKTSYIGSLGIQHFR